MTALTTRPRTIALQDLRQLGAYGGLRYAEHDGREYVVDGPLAPADVARPARDGEIRATKQRERIVDGTHERYVDTYRGIEVAVGTYSSLASRTDAQEARRRLRDQHRPVDRLAGIGAKQPLVILAPTLAPTVGPDTAPMPMVDGRPARRGPAELVAWLTDKGVNLTVTPTGKLMIYTPGGRVVGGEADRAITEGARLIIGHLTGRPVLCEAEHTGSPPPAQTIVDVDVAVCEECAR